jgi:uncharacterized delta-60 repeat protein
MKIRYSFFYLPFLVFVNSIFTGNAQPTYVDTSFNPGSGFNSRVIASAIQPDGKIIIGGWFTEYNGVSCNRIVRLNEDATIDTSFNYGTGLTGASQNYLRSIAIQSDGKILLGGQFAQYNGFQCNNIIRVNPNGSVDTSFNTGTGASYWVNTIVLDSDNKILIGGNFSTYNGIARSRIARLNTGGTLDTTFSCGTCANYYVNTIDLQSDGSIIVGGNFTEINNISTPYLARLNIDGVLDTTFNFSQNTISASFNRGVKKLIVDANDRIIVASKVNNYQGFNLARVGAINPDGSYNTTFYYNSFSDDVEDIALLPDNSIIAVGSFKTINHHHYRSIVRLNENGEVNDPFVGLITRADSAIFTVSIQSDERIIIGGEFNSFSGIPRKGIARLNLQDNTSIYSLEGKFGLHVFPNPTIDRVTVYSGNGNIRTISVVDISGRELIKAIVNSNQETIDTSSLNSGVYFIFASMNNEEWVCKRFIKK